MAHMHACMHACMHFEARMAQLGSGQGLGFPSLRGEENRSSLKSCSTGWALGELTLLWSTTRHPTHSPGLLHSALAPLYIPPYTHTVYTVARPCFSCTYVHTYVRTLQQSGQSLKLAGPRARARVLSLSLSFSAARLYSCHTNEQSRIFTTRG